MFTISNTLSTEIERKQSRFLSFLCPYKDFEKTLEELKKEYPKAAHHVWAYRYLNENKQIVENQTDANEPHRTAGFPTLNVLRGNDMIDCALITIRHFGGTLLGMGGLVKAYSDAANEVVQKAKLEPHIIKTQYNIHIAFSDIGKFEHRCKQENIDITQKDFDDKGATFTLEAEEELLTAFLTKS